jgi:hypothetical protein
VTAGILFEEQVMLRVVLISVVLLLACCDSNRGSELGFPSKAFGVAYVSSIPSDVLEKTPAWSDKDENPPLSARKALGMTEEVVKRMIKTPDDWKVKLEGLTLCREGSRWYWHAQFVWHPKAGGFSGVPPHLDVIVLMDGRVIEPRVIALEP